MRKDLEEENMILSNEIERLKEEYSRECNENDDLREQIRILEYKIQGENR